MVLSVPFVTQRINLVCELSCILITESFILTDYSSQTLSCHNKSTKYIHSSLLGYLFLLSIYRLGNMLELACYQIKHSSTIWSYCVNAMFFLDTFSKSFCNFVFSVYNKNLLGFLFRKAINPIE